MMSAKGIGVMKLRASLAAFVLVVGYAIPAAAGGGGFDEYGYNDTARIFNGTGSSWCLAGGQSSSCMGIYSPDQLVMKWTAEWDRGNADNWTDPNGYRGAWTDNEWNSQCAGCSGEV